MNIKSLLLGSAAAMVAVSSAQAADAVVVEAEPVEYVRVCDAYGSGFFFIPGTETCIRFGGFVRSAYEKLTFDNDDAAIGEQSFTLWGQRARLNIDVRNETDWGTLRSVYRLEGGQSNVDTDIDMDVALISLAGFRAGFAGANYWSTNHGFGGVNSESVASTASGVIYPDGFYGFDDATIFDYTWAADGLSVTVGVEDTRISYGRGNAVGGGDFLNTTNNGGIDDGASFYAGLNYSGDFGTFAFTAAHDTNAVDFDDLAEVTAAYAGAAAPGGRVGNGEGGWAYKVSLNLDLSEFIPGGSIHGWYANDGDYDTDYVHSNLLTLNPESIWGVGFNANLSDEVEFWALYSAVEGTDISAAVGAIVDPLAVATETGDAELISIGLNWFPAAAPGFHIKSSYSFGEVENNLSPVIGVAAGDADFDGFEVTLRRDF